MIAIVGFGVVASSIIIFCGSVFLLLALVMGARLAYFITASVTLAVLVIMGVVWSINPLGPIGKAPEWNGVEAADTATDLKLAAAKQYPDSPWDSFDIDDPAEAAESATVEGAAPDILAEEISKGTVTTFTDEADAVVNSEETRKLEEGDDLYAAVTFEPATSGTGSAVVLLKFDPGNPLGPPRKIAAGIVAVFLLHLFGLSRLEKKARKPEPEPA